jgi:hypothetical protein
LIWGSCRGSLGLKFKTWSKRYLIGIFQSVIIYEISIDYKNDKMKVILGINHIKFGGYFGCFKFSFIKKN